MGATNFYCKSKGVTAEEAFTKAVKDYQWENGHRGYTGTIAEKSTFSMASSEPLSSPDAFELANSLLDVKYNDKWGPAGCIQLLSTNSQPSEIKKFLFFGWASS
tara:strand:+ start:634 stop:945 length:312 start_codon:yes stop_codon:yes gene_type:complete